MKKNHEQKLRFLSVFRGAPTFCLLSYLKIA